MVGGAGKAGGGRRFIYQNLGLSKDPVKNNLMTRRNKAGKIEYCIGGDKDTIANTPKKAIALYTHIKAIKGGKAKPKYAFGAAKIKGRASKQAPKRSKPLTAKQRAARKKAAGQIAKKYSILKLIK